MFFFFLWLSQNYILRVELSALAEFRSILCVCLWLSEFARQNAVGQEFAREHAVSHKFDARRATQPQKKFKTQLYSPFVSFLVTKMPPAKLSFEMHF